MEGFFSRLFEPEASLILTRVSNFLTELDVKSYLVGGFVRDVLLGRSTADIDIAIAADALEIAPKIASAVDGKYVPLDKVIKVGRVVPGRLQLDANGSLTSPHLRAVSSRTWRSAILQ